jgi:hypothetical protein
MNIGYTDGSRFIGPYDADKLQQEAARPDFVSAKVYEPGKTLTIGGTEYRVGNAGNLIRVRHA